MYKICVNAININIGFSKNSSYHVNSDYLYSRIAIVNQFHKGITDVLAVFYQQNETKTDLVFLWQIKNMRGSFSFLLCFFVRLNTQMKPRATVKIVKH